MVPPSVPTIYNSAPYLEPGVSGDEPYLVKIDPSLEHVRRRSSIPPSWEADCRSKWRGEVFVPG